MDHAKMGMLEVRAGASASWKTADHPSAGMICRMDRFGSFTRGIGNSFHESTRLYTLSLSSVPQHALPVHHLRAKVCMHLTSSHLSTPILPAAFSRAPML